MIRIRGTIRRQSKKEGEAPKHLASQVGEISKETSNHPGATHQPIELRLAKIKLRR
jgi:hypothetical protein